VFTIGHGARPLDAFLDLLAWAGVGRLIDVRTAPGSRRHPHFSRDALAATLPEHDVTYEWWGRDLGGFRRPRPDSPHTALRVEAFRGYADHMQTPEFTDALERLMAAAAEAPTAIMCAEAFPYRCHRRLISDWAELHGVEVIHLLDEHRHERHKVTAFARHAADGGVVYEADPQLALPLA